VVLNILIKSFESFFLIVLNLSTNLLNKFSACINQMTQKAFKSVVKLSNGRDMPVMGLGTLFHKDPKAIEHAICNIGYRNIDTATITMNEA
jgi:hypothetical protein